MLFKVVDHKGTERWINATYVRSIRSRKDKTEMHVTGETMPIYLNQPLDTVAQVVNAAMPLADLTPGDAPGATDQSDFLTLLATGVF